MIKEWKGWITEKDTDDVNLFFPFKALSRNSHHSNTGDFNIALQYLNEYVLHVLFSRAHSDV